MTTCTRRAGAAVAACALLVAACGSDDSPAAPAPAPPASLDEPEPAPDPDADRYVEPVLDTEPDRESGYDVEPPDPDPADDEPEAEPEPGFGGGGVDLSLVRDDVECDDEGLGSDAEIVFSVGHYVVDGNLGAVCFGVEDPTLISSWEVLSQITPPAQLADLGLFGGFVSGEAGDEVTLAFVNALDADGSLFQMSVNLESAGDDPTELAVTLAHEFSHVFTALPSQLDRTDEAIDACATYFSGEGCYTEDSLMWQWIQSFWGDGLIDEIDPLDEATGAAGQERCDRNPGFFGAYAATNPEEDFAETFGAFVFDYVPDTPEQQDKLDWMAARPGLAEFRDRAFDAGLAPLEANFDPCGTAT